MTLNDQQIETLHVFTRNAGVKYYDVQLELVDHLAANIEAQMDANPSLDFEEALKEVYATFGKDGFKKIIKEKKKQVGKRSNALFLIELKQFFTFPKIIISITIFLALLFVAPFLSDDNRYYLIVVTGLLISAYHVYTELTTRKKKMKKALSLSAVIPGGIWVVVLVNNYASFSWADQVSRHNLPSVIFSVSVVCLVLIQVALGNIYYKMIRQAEEHYPAAFS